MQKLISKFTTAVVLSLALAMTNGASAATLYGVTGDGASTSESLFILDQTDATATFQTTFGNGDDGETIGFNPVDGLLYHSSGIDDGDRFWESINLNTLAIVSSGQFTGPAVTEENLAMTYDPTTDRFLVSDRNEIFYSVTTGGVATAIGTTPDSTKGLAFVGGTLFGGQRDTDILSTLDPTNGGSLSSIGVTLGGSVIDGILGLATDPDTLLLWAILKTGSDRTLGIIDPTTGIASAIGILSDKFAGIAFSRGISVVPLPAALPLFGTGLAVMGFIGWRRKRKHTETT